MAESDKNGDADGRRVLPWPAAGSTEVEGHSLSGNEAHAVRCTPTQGAGGVCRVTVFEVMPGQGARRTLRPVAERLDLSPTGRASDREPLKPDEKLYAPATR